MPRILTFNQSEKSLETFVFARIIFYRREFIKRVQNDTKCCSRKHFSTGVVKLLLFAWLLLSPNFISAPIWWRTADTCVIPSFGAPRC